MDFKNYTIEAYIDELSGKSPVPGGGGVSALTGALAMGLSRMVCSLTEGKKKYIDNMPYINEAADELKNMTDRLYDCMEADARAFEPLSAAYGLPKNTEEEIAYKNEVMEKCLYNAALPPLDICRNIAKMVSVIDIVREKGSVIAVSDAGCSAALARAAFEAAALNVLINTRLMKDRTVAGTINEELKRLEQNTVSNLNDIYGIVYDKLMN